MPRTTTRKRASETKSADESVSLPVDVYEDLMKKIKMFNAREKYISDLEETLRLKNQIIAEHDGEWQYLHSRLDDMEEEVREYRETVLAQNDEAKQLEAEAKGSKNESLEISNVIVIDD